MQLVTTVDQIEVNVATLEAIRSGDRIADLNAYVELIKRGTCFLPYQATDGIAFAPSRFIGYVGNSFVKAAANKQRDGRLTNDAINEILRQGPALDAVFEAEYLRFCSRIGISPSPAGSFGVARKYWIIPDVAERIDHFLELEVLSDPHLTATEKNRLVKARVGQGAFREALLTQWKRRCCVTACAIDSVLRASHIKPWRVSSNAERVDRYNGLLLTANIDILFDKGIISFNDNGTLVHEKDISPAILRSLGCDPAVQLKLTPFHAPYLAYHRNEIFGKR